MTNLPLGKLQVGLSTALGIKTLGVLEGSADCTRSNGKVFVVTVSMVLWLAIATDKRQRMVNHCQKLYVKPAAFQAATILTDGGGCED